MKRCWRIDHIMYLSIDPEEGLAARAWKQGEVTRADIAQVYGDHPEQNRKGIGRCGREVRSANSGRAEKCPLFSDRLF
jgi:hypothetical protein